MIEKVIKRATKMQLESIAFFVAMLILLNESAFDFDPGMTIFIKSEISTFFLQI